MGLDTLGESDHAADLAYVALGSMVKELRKGLKEKANEYNTSGPVNVALFFEAFILPAKDEFQSYSDVWDLARETKELLLEHKDRSKKSDWGGDDANKKMHIDAYNRMLRSLDKFLGA